MATVFLARLDGVAGFSRLYAIKRLHPHLANEGEFVDMFLDEARLAARIHHPNVVPILEVGTSAEGYYLVMEYIEGDTAARLLARSTQAGGRLPTGAAVRIAFDTLLGLHAAHELTDDSSQPLHIVHRDVSPQNILVGIDGVSRITDFGVAHAATRLSSTRTGQLKGKLAYMAPEQARGGVVDRRADVFALGVVLWELLAGKRLFKASNDAETLHRILFAPVPTLRGAGINVPIPLEAVCMRALEREAEARYASAADFADELERVGRSLGMLATTREIATYVDGTIGAEISQQREVVRGWLSRSEPSRNERVHVPSSPGSRSGPSQARPSSRDVTILATPGGSAASSSAAPTANRGDVSSLSSAVLHMADGSTSQPQLNASPSLATPPAPPGRTRTRVLWVAGGACGLLLAVGAGFSIPRAPSPVSGISATTTSPPSTPPSAPQTSSPLPARPQPPVSLADAAVPAAGLPSLTPPALPPVVRVPPSNNPPRGGGVVRPPKPPKGTSADDLPDDLSRNPYR